MSSDSITRRDALRAGVITTVALAAAPSFLCAGATEPIKIIPTTPPHEGKPFRIAHLTDMHVTEKYDAQAGYAAALKSIATIDPPPQFLITGGDHIMDALLTTRERAIEQWDMYDKAMREHAPKLKSYPVIGNHDVWGWSAKTDYSAEKDFGKPIAVERLGLKERYYSFDAGGWHFVMLDNIQPTRAATTAISTTPSRRGSKRISRRTCRAIGSPSASSPTSPSAPSPRSSSPPAARTAKICIARTTT
jgi:3',5'-cyclic AMP phosphodiesterase CpdA